MWVLFSHSRCSSTIWEDASGLVVNNMVDTITDNRLQPLPESLKRGRIRAVGSCPRAGASSATNRPSADRLLCLVRAGVLLKPSSAYPTQDTTRAAIFDPRMKNNPYLNRPPLRSESATRKIIESSMGGRSHWLIPASISQASSRSAHSAVWQRTFQHITSGGLTTGIPCAFKWSSKQILKHLACKEGPTRDQPLHFRPPHRLSSPLGLRKASRMFPAAPFSTSNPSQLKPPNDY